MFTGRPTAGEAFATIAWSCLDHLAHNEAVFLRTRDPEALHQLRVAARRLRSAFSVFRPVWRSDPEGARLKAELRAQALPLGRLRDLDVLLESIFDEEAAATAPALRDMRDQLNAQQSPASDDAAAILESVAWRQLISELTHWVQDGAWRRDKKNRRRDRSARSQARRSLGRLRDYVVTQGAGLPDRSPAERHQVRIEGKKLRYGSEFLGSLFPDRAPDHAALVEALEGLQEHLGLLNDIATARAYWAQTGLPEPGTFAADEAAALENAVRDYDRIVAIAPFWSK